MYVVMYIFYYIIRIQSRIQLQICAHRVCTYYVLIYEFASGTKSQMSMLPSYEPLTIWKSSNCRPYTESKCSCDKSKRKHQSWPLLKLKSQNPIHTIPDCNLIQNHRSRYSRCSGHWIIIVLGLVLGC